LPAYNLVRLFFDPAGSFNRTADSAVPHGWSVEPCGWRLAPHQLALPTARLMGSTARLAESTARWNRLTKAGIGWTARQVHLTAWETHPAAPWGHATARCPHSSARYSQSTEWWERSGARVQILDVRSGVPAARPGVFAVWCGLLTVWSERPNRVVGTVYRTGNPSNRARPSLQTAVFRVNRLGKATRGPVDAFRQARSPSDLVTRLPRRSPAAAGRRRSLVTYHFPLNHWSKSVSITVGG
jgi:hypothetical protein